MVAVGEASGGWGVASEARSMRGRMMHDIALSPEVVELVGKAALPVVTALEAPMKKDIVARASWPALDELCQRRDLPSELQARARLALVASRGVIEGNVQAYGKFLGATHALLVSVGLPAPCELAQD
jgi:hypothetical protein